MTASRALRPHLRACAARTLPARRGTAALVAVVALSVVTLGACGGGDDATSATTSTTDSELSVSDIRCRAESEVGSRFDLSPVSGGRDRTLLEGVLIDEYGQVTVFACRPLATPARAPEGSASADRAPGTVTAHPIASCSSERVPWTVELVRDDKRDLRLHIDTARLAPGEGDPELVLPCAAVRQDLVPPTYEEIAPHLHRACGGCHADQFDSLAKIKGQRDVMLGMITSGAMPRRDETWRYRDEGKAVIAFLAKSPELH